MDPKKKILKNLNTLYEQALIRENFVTALKIIELQARLEGYFPSKKTKMMSIKDLSDTDIDTLIKELENS